MDFFDALVRYETYLWNHLDDRLVAAGKPKKLAITDCARKLLTILNAMAKARKPFNAELHMA